MEWSEVVRDGYRGHERGARSEGEGIGQGWV